MSVALTAGTAGKFETRFFHMVFENQFGMCKGHFGPINAMAFHPNGRQFCTGGEDGYVRIQILDDDYFAEDEDDEILKGFSREELLGEIEAEKRDGAGAAETKA